MRKDWLLSCIEEGTLVDDFEVSGFGFTWGLSFIKFAIGAKDRFKNAEHFVYSALHKEEMRSQPSEFSWDDSDKLKRWVDGLIVKEIATGRVVGFMKDSVDEIRQYLHYWEGENTIDTSLVEFPENLESAGLLLKPTA